MSWSNASRCRPLAGLLVAGSLALRAASADAGVDLWTTHGPGSAARPLAIHPTAPAVLYAGTEHGVFKSPDGGETWAPVNNGLTSLSISALAIDPVTPETVYAAAEFLAAPRLFKTLDGGASWTQVGAGLPTGGPLFTTALAVDPSTPSTVFVGVSGLFVGLSPTGFLHKSTDGGLTFATVPVVDVWAIAFDPLTPATLYAGTPGGCPRSPIVCNPGLVWKSTDGGLTWARTSLTAFVTSLAIDPVTPANLYAGAFGSTTIASCFPAAPCPPAGVYRSTDGGATWSLGVWPPGRSVSALAIDPVTPGTVYAGTSEDGIFKSTNGGLTFSLFSPGLPAVAVRALVVDPLDPDILHAATSSGVYDIEQRPPSFDSDALTDLAVFRTTTGEWFIKHSSDGGVVAKEWGAAALGDVPVPADYDGDGRLDVAVFRRTTGQWFIFQSTDGATVAAAFGIGGDVPVVADYDGDGKADFAVLRPATGQWFVFGSATGFGGPVAFGAPGLGDLPIPADYDGDGKTDLAVYRRTTGEWFIFGSATGFAGPVGLGSPAHGDTPVPADYDGDGKADLAVYRQTTGEWFIFGSATGFAGPVGLGSPAHGDTPVPADYDGDGKADLGVFRQTSGEWFIFGSATGSSVFSYGAPHLGDTPILRPSALR